MKKKKSAEIHYKNILIVTGAILAIPFVMTQISTEWDWKLLDFIIIGTLLFLGGLSYEVLSGKVDKRYKIAVGIGIAAVVAAIWVHLAVGIVDTWPFAGS